MPPEQAQKELVEQVPQPALDAGPEQQEAAERLAGQPVELELPGEPPE